MRFYFFTLLLIGFVCKSQTPEIKTDLPTIIPPSPNIANLMKFEEVPVSNYTGVPNITIPLFSTKTLAKDILFDLSLIYHPASVAVEEIAGDVGLGWVLQNGGSISRTVMGLPDEIRIVNSTIPGGNSINGEGKIGLYHVTSSTTNPTVNGFDVFTSLNENPSSDEEDLELRSEFIFDTFLKEKYDSEHDLWQFNFFGNTGRFQIKKNTNGILEVVPLDDYRLKIINHYHLPNNYNQNDYMPIGFTIYDEKGYKYVFDIVEHTNEIESTKIFTINLGNVKLTTQPNVNYISGFQLSKVFDLNNNLIINYEYINTFLSKMSVTKTKHYYDPYIYVIPKADGDLKPALFESSVLQNYSSKSISKIEIENNCIINFEYENNREDTNFNNPSSVVNLKSLTIKDFENNLIKKIKFNYDYFNSFYKRLKLKSIEEQNSELTESKIHQFEYKELELPNGFNYGKDYWGYLNIFESCKITPQGILNTHPEFCTNETIKKIIYPTGGVVNFTFEPNTYSFIGNVEETDFFDNPYNFEPVNNENTSLTFTTTSMIQNLSTSSKYRKVSFSSSLILQYGLSYDSLNLQKLNNGVWENIGSLNCEEEHINCCIDFILLPNQNYRVVRHFFSTDPIPNAYLNVSYLEMIDSPKEFNIGGGNRIKKIEYFNHNNIDNSEILREKKYDYCFFDNELSSSGSLVFPKPIYSYISRENPCLHTGIFSDITIDYPIPFEVHTTHNNLKFLRTKGADVGYKNVTVFETGNGYIQYTFSSPIDYPEEHYEYSYPFTPPHNYDFKRGNLLKEEIFSNNHLKKSKTEFSYDLESYLENTGISFYKNVDSYYINSQFVNFSFQIYLDYITKCQNIIYPFFTCMDEDHVYPIYCGCMCFQFDIFNSIAMYNKYQAYGWAKLTQKTTTNYFYEGSTTQEVVTREDFTYNPINKQVASHTITTSQGDVIEKNYFYHTGNSIYSQNRISEIERIETKKNNELVSSTQLVYSTNFAGNAAVLPQQIQVKKSNQPFTTKVRFMHYDLYGNPLEVQQENGIAICYIWGYNHSQPIAKIENATAAAVCSALGVMSLSSLNETHLASIDNLRQLLPNAMVSTYTHQPLVGITKVKDPNGDETTYSYDSFLRLSHVYDLEGYLQQEFKYHYRD